eukprot:1521881-Rhodomonas_salina.1
MRDVKATLPGSPAAAGRPPPAQRAGRRTSTQQCRPRRGTAAANAEACVCVCVWGGGCQTNKQGGAHGTRRMCVCHRAI